MALFPVYTFDSETNYSDAELTVKEMVSYIDDKRYNGKLKPYVKSTLAEVNPILTVMAYNSASDLNNVNRWKKNIETAYKLLYPIAN